MRSSRLLVVWMVVLVSLTGIPSSATAPLPSETQQNDSGTIKRAVGGELSYLAINESIKRNATVTISQDIGIAVALDTIKFQQEYGNKRLKIAHKNASNETAFATNEIDTVETQAAELRKRQNDTIRRYNNGMSSEMFLRQLALISTEARRIQVLANYLTDVGNESVVKRANDISQEMNMFQGPVRNRIRSALNREPSAPNRFFVRTSSDGVVLATIDKMDGEQVYLREAYLDGARSGPEGSNDLDRNYMREKVNKLYPDVGGKYIQKKGGSNSFYRYELYPPEYVSENKGKIRQYVDRGSGNIVFEWQRITINDERTVEHEAQKAQNGQLALTQGTTYPGGYMYVRLTHPKEGEPRNGNVSVGGESVGTTGGETLLMLQPPNGSTITGTVGNENVSVTTGNEPQQSPGPAGTDSKQGRNNHIAPISRWW